MIKSDNPSLSNSEVSICRQLRCNKFSFSHDYHDMLLRCNSTDDVHSALLFMIANELMDLNQTLIHIEEKL